MSSDDESEGSEGFVKKFLRFGKLQSAKFYIQTQKEHECHYCHRDDRRSTKGRVVFKEGPSVVFHYNDSCDSHSSDGFVRQETSSERNFYDSDAEDSDSHSNEDRFKSKFLFKSQNP